MTGWILTRFCSCKICKGEKSLTSDEGQLDGQFSIWCIHLCIQHLWDKTRYLDSNWPDWCQVWIWQENDLLIQTFTKWLLWQIQPYIFDYVFLKRVWCVVTCWVCKHFFCPSEWMMPVLQHRWKTYASFLAYILVYLLAYWYKTMAIFISK